MILTHLVYMGMHDLKPSSIDSSCSEPVICSWRLSNCVHTNNKAAYDTKEEKDGA